MNNNDIPQGNLGFSEFFQACKQGDMAIIAHFSKSSGEDSQALKHWLADLNPVSPHLVFCPSEKSNSSLLVDEIQDYLVGNPDQTDRILNYLSQPFRLYFESPNPMSYWQYAILAKEILGDEVNIATSAPFPSVWEHAQSLFINQGMSDIIDTLKHALNNGFLSERDHADAVYSLICQQIVVSTVSPASYCVLFLLLSAICEHDIPDVIQIEQGDKTLRLRAQCRNIASTMLSCKIPNKKLGYEELRSLTRAVHDKII